MVAWPGDEHGAEPAGTRGNRCLGPRNAARSKYPGIVIAQKSQLVVVANRLPVRRVELEDGSTEWATSPGGLVSALSPALQQNTDRCWVGWAGSDSTDSTEPFAVDGMKLVPVPITGEELDNHYNGMSNGTLWPLYHDKVGPVEFHRHWFDGYRTVNKRFAEATAEVAESGATVWIQDYQLHMVPGFLRRLRPDLRIGFFLHIPFPPAELFTQLPWREHLAEGMLGADLIGFQTPRGAANFQRVASFLEVATVDGKHRLKHDAREIRLGAYPIGIDASRYENAARSHEIEERSRDLRAGLGNPRTVLLGVDRLDYTKGIDVRLRAFKELLADGVLHPSQVTMVQVAEPSRDQVDAYADLRARVEQLVSEINGDYGRVGFPVVHYIHQSQDFDELMSLYRAADVMLVTPFADGMNLVAKEYVAARYDESGAMVLSEFAGAAHQLSDALTVNPYDIDGVKAAVAQAVSMSPEEQRTRLRALREVVKSTDVSFWVESFLNDLAGEADAV
jgi:trehalose 6-phosphate synthase